MISTKVSLVSTLKDEADSIGPFIHGLLRQSRLPEEIVLVDGGSTDDTVAQIERFGPSAGVPIRVIQAPGTNISEGRNIGIAATANEVIAVTDAGTRPQLDWLEKLVAPFESDPEVGVSCGFFLPTGNDWRHRTLAIAITPQREEIDPDKFLPSSRSVAFRRSWWSEVGGYPEWLRHCEDLVFDLELRKAGARFVFVPDAIVTWDARPDLRSFARQYFNYARGDGHANLWLKRHVLRYGAYGTGLLGITRRGRRPVAWALLLGGWFGYQAKFFRRLMRIPPSASNLVRLCAFAYLPVVVTTGDLAKMVGYLVGSFERRTRVPALAGSDGPRPVLTGRSNVSPPSPPG
jgi:cellulose synthase/poly-beta-1,6-N-acetylglucosamine synthase-like glycosyltransferase